MDIEIKINKSYSIHTIHFYISKDSSTNGRFSCFSLYDRMKVQLIKFKL